MNLLFREKNKVLEVEDQLLCPDVQDEAGIDHNKLKNSFEFCYYWHIIIVIIGNNNYYYWHIYPPTTRKRRSAVRARLGVAGHLSTTLRLGESR